MGASFSQSDASCACVLDTPLKVQVRLRVGSVSPLVDVPLQLAAALSRFGALGVKLHWVRCCADANAAMAMLAAGLLDVALMPTEDAVLYAARGSSARICGTLVKTSRAWGLYRSTKRGAPPAMRDGGIVFGLPEELGARTAVELLGMRLGIQQLLCRFCSTPKLANEQMLAEHVHFTVWETWMSRHLVEIGEWQLLREMLLPWPSTMFVAAREALHNKAGALRSFVEYSGALCAEFACDPATAARCISASSGLSVEGALAWLRETTWACSCEVSEAGLALPLQCLQRLGALPAGRCLEPSKLLAGGICRLEPTTDPAGGRADPPESPTSRALVEPEGLPFGIPPAGEVEWGSEEGQKLAMRL